MHLKDALLDGEGRIDAREWARAEALALPVGECDLHAVHVFAGEVSVDFWHRRFYTVTCAGGHESVVPAGRVVRDPSVSPIFGVWSSEAFAEAARDRDAAILGERDDEPVPA